MARSELQRVLAQMGEHLGLRDMHRLQGGGLLEVGGHELLLHHDTKNAPHQVQARLNLGPADPHQREWIWHRMLVSNFEWACNGSLGWSLSPEGDLAMFTAHHPLDAQTTGSELAAWLRELLVCALAHWRALLSRQAMADLQALAPLRRARRPVSTQPDGWEPLIDAFCDHVGIAERHALRRGEDSLRVDGMDMLLRHDRLVPGRFQVSLDLGMAPIGPCEKLWQGLLWSNFLMGAGGDVLFSVLPQREAVVMTLQQTLPVEPSAQAFCDLLHALAAQGQGVWDALRDTVSRMETAMPAGPPAQAGRRWSAP